MENKYEEFIKGIDNLKSEDMKRECKTLIRLAQRYYSKYDHYQEMQTIKNELSKAYGTTEDGKINIEEIKPNKLTPINQLYIQFYLEIFYHENYGGRKKYTMIQAYKEELEGMIQRLGGFTDGSSIPRILKEKKQYEQKSDKECIDLVKNTFKLMAISCQKACDKYGNTKIIDIKPGSAQEMMESYDNNSKYIVHSEETSFNEVFSDEYVEKLLNIMDTEEGLLPIFIAPVRTQLCYKKEGGREIDSKARREYFKMGFRSRIDKLDEETEKIRTACNEFHKLFIAHKKRLTIFSNIGIFNA